MRANKLIYIGTGEQFDREWSAFGAEVRQIGIDIETTNFDRTAGALEPTDGDISTIQISDGSRTLVIDALQIGLNNLRPVRELIANPKILKIAHNAKFEVKWFLHHLNVEPAAFYCTMLASQIIAAGDVTAEHHLRNVALVFAGIELDKTEQTSNWGARPLTASQLEYAALDAEVVLDIYPKQVVRLKADDLLRVATIEFDYLRPMAKIELNGMHLDADKWRALLDRKKAELAALHAEMLDLLQAGVDWTEPNPAKRGKRPVKPVKPVDPRRAKINRGRVVPTGEILEYERQLSEYQFEVIEWQRAFESWNELPDTIPATLNPNSPPQMIRVLKNVTGISFKSTRNDFLLPYVKVHPAIAKLVEYRGAAKLVSSYGDNILEALDGESRVHTEYKQILDTGRSSSRNPNLQQVPHDEEYRACFTAPRGRKLIIADYSQIELRLLAEFSGDPVFVSDFNSGADLHTMGASRFNRVALDKVTADMRQGAKKTNFGVVYGIGDEKLGRQLDIETWRAGKLKDSYFSTYRGNQVFLQLSNQMARENLIARTSSGRLQRFSHDGSRGQIAAVGRNGQNMPIQGSSADMMKRAVYLADLRLAGTSGIIVNVVHDEIVAEANEADADRVLEIILGAMEDAGREYLTRVPAKVEGKVADSWAEK